eukprot:m.253742 g.253742  ORF g.253742 m.253742 type:complete len:90 (-) comp15486_c2_seq7:762-1031(-)
MPRHLIQHHFSKEAPSFNLSSCTTSIFSALAILGGSKASGNRALATFARSALTSTCSCTSVLNAMFGTPLLYEITTFFRCIQSCASSNR